MDTGDNPVSADGGEARPLLTRPFDQHVGSWSPDGQVFAYVENNPTTGFDIWLLPADDEASTFLVTSFGEHSPVFSPDGRWIAYVSNQSGRDEVYVREVVDREREFPVSTEGGREPRWSPDGAELYFRNGSAMFAVDVVTEPTWDAGLPRQLFQERYRSPSFLEVEYDVHPDGQRFLMVTDSTPDEIRIVYNWTQELLERVPID